MMVLAVRDNSIKDARMLALALMALAVRDDNVNGARMIVLAVRG